MSLSVVLYGYGDVSFPCLTVACLFCTTFTKNAAILLLFFEGTAVNAVGKTFPPAGVFALLFAWRVKKCRSVMVIVTYRFSHICIPLM